MPFDVHTIEIPDGCNVTLYDRVIVGAQLAIANAAGGSAGATVTTAVSFPSGLPAAYFVQVVPSQACFATVTSKTATGFNVVLTPTGSGVTLAAGTFDVMVLA
jgi:hypothetical protein